MPQPSGGVRPLSGSPPPRRGGWGIATAVAVVLVGSGVLLAVLNRPLDRGGSTVPTLADTPDTLASADTTSATTVPVLTNGLSAMVPEFEGRLAAMRRHADGSLSGWTWLSDEPSPVEFDLPGTGQGAWDPFLERLAAVLEVPVAGPALYFGPPDDVREVFPGVESFAWHPTNRGLLAFVTEPQADGRPQLWRSLPDSETIGVRTFTSTLVGKLDFEAEMVAYGDWGFALEEAAGPGRLPLLVTLDAEGSLIAQAQYGFLDATPDGRLLVTTDLATGQLGIVGTELFPVEQIPAPSSLGAIWSPDGTRIATVSGGDTEASLLIVDDTGTRLVIQLDLAAAPPVAWSKDGRWILLSALGAEPGEDGQPALVFVDLTRPGVYLTQPGVYQVPAPPGLMSLTIDSAGGPDSAAADSADS